MHLWSSVTAHLYPGGHRVNKVSGIFLEPGKPSSLWNLMISMATHWSKEPEHKHLEWQSIHRPEKSWQREKLSRRTKREWYGRLHTLMVLGWQQPPQLPHTALDHQKHLVMNRPLVLLLDTSSLWEGQYGAAQSESPPPVPFPTLPHQLEEGPCLRKTPLFGGTKEPHPHWYSWEVFSHCNVLSSASLSPPAPHYHLLGGNGMMLHTWEILNKGTGLNSGTNSRERVSKTVHLEKEGAPSGGWDQLTWVCKDRWWAALPKSMLVSCQ